MSKKINVQRVRGEDSKFFRGEMMTCHYCNRQQRSNPKKSSQWTVVEMEGNAIYICPNCWGNNRGGWQNG